MIIEVKISKSRGGRPSRMRSSRLTPIGELLGEEAKRDPRTRREEKGGDVSESNNAVAVTRLSH